MIEQELAAIFVELRRVGVDLGRPPGLALGTGFRPGEFLPWLRALPDGLGHDAFVERLEAHIAAAAPVAQPNDSGLTEPGRAPPFFACPTLEQLGAAIDVLTQEWDPLGARLGELSRDSVSEHAFNALAWILGAGTHEKLEGGLAHALGAVEEHEFGVRRSPPSQRQYLARRLMQVVVDHPAPPDEDDLWRAPTMAGGSTVGPVELGPHGRTVSASSRTVKLGPRGDEPPALDPHATCSQCGITGTVAVVMREVEPVVSRYCADCWRSVRDRYLNRRPPADTGTPEGTIAVFAYMRSMMRDRVRYTASALWEDSLEFIRAASEPNAGESPASQAKHLERLARELRRRAPAMAGPMPAEIEAFVSRYAPPHA